MPVSDFGALLRIHQLLKLNVNWLANLYMPQQQNTTSASATLDAGLPQLSGKLPELPKDDCSNFKVCKATLKILMDRFLIFTKNVFRKLTGKGAAELISD